MPAKVAVAVAAALLVSACSNLPHVNAGDQATIDVQTGCAGLPGNMLETCRRGGAGGLGGMAGPSM